MKSSNLFRRALLFLMVVTSSFSYGEIVNLTAMSGSISWENENYENNLDYTYSINTNTNQPITINYSVNAEPTFDYMAIIEIDLNGYESEIAWIDYEESGSYTTSFPSGKAKVVIFTNSTIDFWDNQEYYTGFYFSYQAVTNHTFNQTQVTNNNANIAGKLGVGIVNPLTRLHINGPIRGDGPAGSLTVNTTYGNVTMGATSSTQATISTDRSYFQFDKSVYLSTGIVNSTTSSLQLRTDNSPRLTILNSNGNVGINNTSPGQKLSVRGNLSLYSSGTTTPNENYKGNLMITRSSGNQFINLVKGTTAWSIGVKGNNYAIGPGNTTDGSFTPSFVITPGGYIGIGTTSPDKSLTVNGTIHAKEVLVDYAIPFPDYVFDKKYTLRTLYDVDAFIKDRGHLPDIPSAEEVGEKGINLAELQVRLLQKIEELTLYAVDQQKRLDEQQARIDALEKALTLERTK